MPLSLHTWRPGPVAAAQVMLWPGTQTMAGADVVAALLPPVEVDPPVATVDDPPIEVAPPVASAVHGP
jgi:hypothetical protein